MSSPPRVFRPNFLITHKINTKLYIIFLSQFVFWYHIYKYVACITISSSIKVPMYCFICMHWIMSFLYICWVLNLWFIITLMVHNFYCKQCTTYFWFVTTLHSKSLHRIGRTIQVHRNRADHFYRFGSSSIKQKCIANCKRN